MYDLDVDFRLIERREDAAARQRREDALEALRETLLRDRLCRAALAWVAATLLALAASGASGAVLTGALPLLFGAWLGLGAQRSAPRIEAIRSQRAARRALLSGLRMR